MKKYKRLKLLAVMLCALFLVETAYAGCKSDCSDEYESEKDSCEMMWSEPEEAEDLTSCIDDAKSDYDYCIEECES